MSGHCPCALTKEPAATRSVRHAVPSPEVPPPPGEVREPHRAGATPHLFQVTTSSRRKARSPCVPRLTRSSPHLFPTQNPQVAVKATPAASNTTSSISPLTTGAGLAVAGVLAGAMVRATDARVAFHALYDCFAKSVRLSHLFFLPSADLFILPFLTPPPPRRRAR